MKILFSQANLLRKKEFQIQTVIFEENKKIFVRKIALNDSAFNHLNKMINYYSVLKRNKIKTAKILDSKKNYLQFEFLSFPSLQYLIEEKIYDQDFEELNKLLKIAIDFINSLKKTKTNPYQNENFSKIFDPQKLVKQTNEECFNLGILDLNFDNLLFDQEKKQIYLIDYEWFFEFPIPKKLILYRSIFYLSLHLQSLIKNRCSQKFPCFEILKNFYVPKVFWEKLNIKPDEVKKYHFWEINFQNFVNQLQIKYDKNMFFENFIEKKKKLDNSLYQSSLSQINQIHQLQSQLQNQQSYIKNLETQIQQLQQHANNLEKQIEKIKSAKFFKLWQGYCLIRKKIIGR